MTLLGAASDDTATAGIRLLGDIRSCWASATRATSATPLASDVADVAAVADKAPTDALLRELRNLDESPWGDWYGKPLDSRGLAKLLKPYGIKPTQLRIGDATPRGYRRSEFTTAWRTYVPGGSETAKTSATPLASQVLDVADVLQDPPRCAACGQPMKVIGPGQRYHPLCEPGEPWGPGTIGEAAQ